MLGGYEDYIGATWHN